MKKTTTFPLRVLVAALATALAPAAARADLTKLPLEQLLEMRVVAASSYEQAASEAPSAVSVITAEDIRRYGYRTLAEALQSLPGLYVNNDLSYEYLGSRGFNRIGDYNSRFQLSVNGLRTNDALFDMAYVGTEFPIDMALIERIEFAPGPGSSIYGSNAMLGVINVVTRTGAQLSGLRATAAAGSHGGRELGVSFGKRFDNGVEMLASVSGLRDDGASYYFPAFDAPETNGGVASNQAGETMRRSYLRVSYAGFDLEAFQGRRNKLAPSVYSDSDFLRADNRLIDEMKFAVLRYQREVARGTRVEARVSAGAYDYVGVYPVPDGMDVRDDARGRWSGAEARVVTTAFEGHKIVAGVELQDDTRLYQRNADPTTVYVDRDDHGRRYAAYAQDEFRLAEGWLLNAGVRYDRYYSFGSSINPRVALVGQVLPGTTVKLLYGSAFRAPNAYELYYQSASFASNERLHPERMRSVEAVVEQDRGGTLRWRTSLFQYRFLDLIDQQGEDLGYVFRNAGSVTGRGAEFTALASLPLDFRARVSASLHDVRDQADQRVTNSPRYTAKLGLDAPVMGSNVRAAVDMVAIGPRLDRNRDTIGTTLLTNFVLSTRAPWNGALFSLGVYNVFDRRNESAGSEYFAQPVLPDPGRTFRLAAEWTF